MNSDQHFDVIIVGTGAAGAATAWSCARRGLRVLALDRFEPGHNRGSSHGTERIVRVGHTDAIYVDLALDALARWAELEAAANTPLLTRTGAIDFGIESELEQIVATTEACGVQMEALDRATAQRRYEGFTFAGDVLYHREGGTVHAERAVSVLRHLAVGAGATMRATDPVVAVDQLDSGVAVRTAARTWYADVAVVTTGAWAPFTLDRIAPLPDYRVTQEQLAFFKPDARFTWPPFIARTIPRYYGMATPDGLFKIAEHHTGPTVHPDQRTFELDPATWARLIDWVGATLPGLDPTPVDSATCLYASTPDEDFLVDRVGDVVIGVGLSGHGFKFIPELGHRLADLVDGTGWVDNPFTVVRTPRHIGASEHH